MGTNLARNTIKEEPESPYANSHPKDRVLPSLRQNKRTFDYNVHEKYIDKVADELDFRKLVQSIFDKTQDNPYAAAIHARR
jgi:hypothetical protein